MYTPLVKRSVCFAVLTVTVLSLTALCFGQSEEELQVLRMYFKEDELVVTPTRQPKPVSQVAEDITIVTAKEIELMNAHTLADVLVHVPGIAVDMRGGPGSSAAARIQGSEFRHVLVMIDGVAVNNLSDNVAELATIPVQMIERVEVIKGPASSSWGSSLGGVVNVITKSPDGSRKIGGLLSASYGERNTGDYRAEASGTVGAFGYYLYAANMVSDGLTTNTDTYRNDFYTKLTLALSERATVTATFDYSMGDRGDGRLSDFDVFFRNDFENLYATAAFQYKLTDSVEMSLSGRISRRSTGIFTKEVFEGAASTSAEIFNDSNDGGSARLTWAEGMHAAVLGADYDHGTLKSRTIENGKQTLEKWAVYLNDTITYKSFSATPGLRYDHTSTNGDFWSPSLGLTWRVHDTTILRGYVARGFSIPPLSATFGSRLFEGVRRESNPDLEVEKVNAYQVGAESTAIPYVWVKGTLFRYDVSDAIETVEEEEGGEVILRAVNSGKALRQGFEVEVRTVPVYNMSLYAGFAFVDAENKDDDDRIGAVGRYTYDVGVLYDDRRTFRALLLGHYIWWDTTTEATSDFEGKYSAFVWDISLMKKFDLSQNVKGELFFTAHNIFNGAQYLFGDSKNPGRWVEGGLRVKF